MKRNKRRKVKTVMHAGISIREIRPNYFMVDMMRDGKRERVCFTDLQQAKTHCEVIARKIQNEGTSALSLNPDQRSDAVKALEKLRGSATLLDAADFWMLHNGGAEGVTIRELGESFLKSIIAAGCRNTTLAERRYKINRLNDAIGDTPAKAVTKNALIKWMDDTHLTGATRDGYRRCFHAMFRFAVDENVVTYNPVANIKAIMGDERLPKPFTVKETEAIMRTAERIAPEAMIPTLAVQFFAGLRPGEAMGLQWESINFDEKHIRVMPETSKMRRSRIVEINDALLAWLAPYAKPSGAIGITTQSQFAYYMTKKGIVRISGVKWIQDGPRKTFATMHFATNQDAGKTAAVLGHVRGADILYRHYRGLATAKEAAAYWQIRPVAKDRKLIQFRTA